jgi:predicted dehydrogenase
LLGPIASVKAVGHKSAEVRTVMTGPDAGATFPVEVPTHVGVLTRFVSGVVGTSVYSFDSPVQRQLFEISGSKGTMEVPVSGFDGQTRILSAGANDQSWQSLPPEGQPRGRGVGVLEMARAIRAGRQPLASGELAYHVLDAMLGVEESAESGERVVLDSGAATLDALAVDWAPAERTLS